MIRPILSLAIVLGLLAAACGPGNTQRLLRSAVDARKPKLDECYQRALERDETLAGTVRAKLSVEPKTGVVKSVEFLNSVGDDALRSCMEDALLGIRVDQPATVQVDVEYAFDLVPTGGGEGYVAPQ